MEHRGRVAIITGVSSGIGRQLALDFAARGASLVVCARRADALADVARACGPNVEALAGDVADRAFTEGLVTRALERFGRVDVVVNNAGISKHKQLVDVTPDEVDYVMRVNLLAPVWLTLAALPPMMARGEGWIVNVSSMAGKLPPPREAVYAASKFGLTGFTEGCWLDLEGTGVHTAVIHVGPIDTEIWRKTDEPTAYRGPKLPPSAVSAAVFDCIERRRHEAWVPKRMRVVWLFRVFFPGLFRRGAARFDPIPPDVLERARLNARARSTHPASR